MLKNWLRAGVVCAALLIGGGLAPRPASAHMIDVLMVNLPYPVNVGGTTLPAGAYTIRTEDLGSASPILVFQSENGASAAVPVMKIARPSNNGGKAELVIDRRGDSYKLDKIWMDGYSGFWLR